MAVVAVASVACTAPDGASAQDGRETIAARALFQEGLAFVDAQRWTDARDRFERALQLHRSSIVAFNLATVCVHLGRFVEATELFEEVTRDAAAPEAARTAAARQLDALRPRLAHLLLRLVGDAADVTLRLDAAPLSSALVGVAVPVDPGAHVADAQRGGATIARSSVDATPGRTAELTLRLPAAPPPLVGAGTQLAVARTPAHTGGDDSVWVWLGVGIGVAIVAAVVVTVVVLTLPATPAEWPGDTSPGVLRW